MVAVCSVLGLRMLYHNDENVSGPLTPVPETQIPKEEIQKLNRKLLKKFTLMFSLSGKTLIKKKYTEP